MNILIVEYPSRGVDVQFRANFQIQISAQTRWELGALIDEFQNDSLSLKASSLAGYINRTNSKIYVAAFTYSYAGSLIILDVIRK